ncbi:MAG: IspD/TarI family cytidylyltransferase [Candidatus Omnitrophota bacterium]|nr:IspD/TarI family cytidylyltransferase [Candidatus Omnitrophota bacterium]
MPKPVKIEAIVPAAGLGVRLKTAVAKPFVRIDDCAIIIRALRVLSRNAAISKIIVLAHNKNLAKVRRLIEADGLSKVKCVRRGGKTRRDSVAAGLKLLDKDTDFVLIHDAARPFVTGEIISRVVSGAQDCGACIAGVPLKPTIKSIKYPRMLRGRQVSPDASGQASIEKKNIFVDKTLDRRNIWEIQTPQVFRRDLIIKAHNKFKNLDATDDAYLVEKLGYKVRVCEGSYFNIKITTPEDLVFAEVIAKRVKPACRQAGIKR